jgi:hypothetical protein
MRTGEVWVHHQRPFGLDQRRFALSFDDKDQGERSASFCITCVERNCPAS